MLSPSGRTYQVTTRSLKRTVNSCTCPDFQTNLLGTCKHIEAVLAVLGKKLRGKIDKAELSAPPTAEVVEGPLYKRDLLYATPAFFTLVNYELLLRGQQVFEKLAPDLVILDEAQRVKNWRTKTAQTVKRLRSRYAFVLTGTPIENNLDELYSVLQTLDSRLLGPLWQFNARYFQLERRPSGSFKVLGHKNLEELRRRISPLVLRRNRSEVLKDLSPRVDNNFFVPMTPQQLGPYKDYQSVVAQLVSVAQ